MTNFDPAALTAWISFGKLYANVIGTDSAARQLNVQQKAGTHSTSPYLVDDHDNRSFQFGVAVLFRNRESTFNPIETGSELLKLMRRRKIPDVN
jgi:hypothetical protein